MLSLLLGCALASGSPGLRLPAGEHLELWVEALALAGLEESGSPWVEVQVDGDTWALTSGTRCARVPAPEDVAGREQVAFLAASLLRPATTTSAPPAPDPSPPEDVDEPPCPQESPSVAGSEVEVEVEIEVEAEAEVEVGVEVEAEGEIEVTAAPQIEVEREVEDAAPVPVCLALGTSVTRGPSLPAAVRLRVIAGLTHEDLLLVAIGMDGMVKSGLASPDMDLWTVSTLAGLWLWPGRPLGLGAFAGVDSRTYTAEELTLTASVPYAAAELAIRARVGPMAVAPRVGLRRDLRTTSVRPRAGEWEALAPWTASAGVDLWLNPPSTTPRSAAHGLRRGRAAARR